MLVGAICFVLVILIPKRTSKSSIGISVRPKTQVAIIPHIDVAKDSRLKFLNNLDKSSEVFILSTNHFDTSSSGIVYSNDAWSLINGEINHALQDDKFDYPEEDQLIKSDHGIRNVITDLATINSKANYHSLLIKNGVSNESLDALAQKIVDLCRTKSCQVLGSVDFSHYNPSAIAELHDKFSIKALQSDNLELLTKSETDSPEVLRVVKKVANSYSLNNFELYENNNSGKQAGNLTKETTSWLIGSFNASAPDDQSTQLMFAGDIMMDRLINHRFKNNFPSIFDDFRNRVFSGVDAAIANFEGPLAESEVEDDISVNNLVFNFPFSSVSALKYVKLNGFSLANNHTLNDGVSGLGRTRKLLAENGFFNFGDPNKLNEFSLKRLDDANRVSLIGVNLLESINMDSLKKIIKDEKASERFVIIYPHWGNEYQTSHSSAQSRVAHEMIDSGADLIIGSHPHVVQDSEIYKNKPIFYSLGNFVFDQTFSEETQRGLIIGVNIDQKNLTLSLIPVESKNLKPRLSVGSNREQLIKRALPQEFINQGASGIMILSR